MILGFVYQLSQRLLWIDLCVFSNALRQHDCVDEWKDFHYSMWCQESHVNLADWKTFVALKASFSLVPLQKSAMKIVGTLSYEGDNSEKSYIFPKWLWVVKNFIKIPVRISFIVFCISPLLYWTQLTVIGCNNCKDNFRYIFCTIKISWVTDRLQKVLNTKIKETC